MSTIKWGVLGYGNIAKRFIKSLSHSQQGTLQAIASQSQFEILKQSFPDLSVYANYNELLADPEIDVVYIALPHYDHYRYSKEVLLAQKGVFTEKPAALYPAQVQELLNLSHSTRVFFGEALKTRYSPALHHLQAEINHGLIGPVQFIYVNFCDDFSHLPKSKYFFDPKQGGALWDLGSYPLGFISFFNQSNLERVDVKQVMENGIDRTTNATLYFEDQMKAHLEVSTTHIETRTAFIKGSEGFVYLDNANRPTSYSVVHGSETKTYEFPLLVDDLFQEIEAVHQALKAGLIETPEFPHQEILRVSQYLETIRQANQEK